MISATNIQLLINLSVDTITVTIWNSYIKLARETGFEPATSAVTGQRSNQLNYSRALSFLLIYQENQLYTPFI